MKKILYALAFSLLALPLHVKAAEPDGTKERPYVIATVEDLCNAWQLVKNFTLDDSIYFVQTADIDMAGITEWHAIMSNTKYVILYNGQNHVIRNFAPSAHSINSSENLYGTSLFGVLRGGEIKNLGVINAICGRCTGYRNSYANSGIIASFATGNSNICLNIDNVFITGTVVGEDGETGGMIGDVELNINMSNCYADVTIIGNDGSDSNWNYTGGFFGSVYNSNLNISNSYVAGSVSSTRHYTADRIAGRSYNTSYNHVIAFNTGTYTQKENVIVATDETRASLIAEIQSWDAFNEGKINNGLPALNWQTDINNEITPDGTKEHPYEIATPEDLCNAYKLVENFAFGKELYGTPLDSIYFIQTADIDMAGIEEWHAIMGISDKKQVSPHFIQYDGERHIIKNFAPSAQIITKTDDYYGTSLFGVLTTGEIKNLGVIDAYCGNCTNGTDNYDNPFVNSGIIISHCKDYTGVRVYIDNVFVTGTVVGKEGDTGGMIGSGGLGLFMSNCYANVNVIGSDDGLTGGLVGYAFMTHPEHITNTYVAGTVQAANADKSGLITGVSTYSCNHVVAFNKGSEKIPSDTKDVSVATDATRAELINKVQAWDAFNERKLFNGLPALNWQTEVDTPVADKTDGTKEHPYEIASAEDLCNAWTHVSGQPGTEYYFIQTADIDMAGHTDWHAISGHSGLYASIIHYDGQKHVIKNFCPQKRTVSAESNYYYSSSLFGVVSGEIKNLGIIDAYIEADNNLNGSGILAAYGGHSNAGQLTIDNVFVTGKVVSNASFTGGMLGTSGNNVIITNSYANVIVEGQSNTASLIGRPNNETAIENVYVAGSVSGDSPCLVIGAGRSQKFNVSNVVAFNTGAESASGIEVDGEIYIATEATKSQFIAEIKNWPAFNAGKIFKGYPALNWQNGIDTPVTNKPDGTKEHPYVIATVEDLCNAWQLVESFTLGDSIYFVQTADIDMAGIKEWHAIAGNKYKLVLKGNSDNHNAWTILYDGKSHIIKNFAPSPQNISRDDNQYGTSLFGVIISGKINNLGIENAYCGNCSNADLGLYNPYTKSGIIASLATCFTDDGRTLDVENVFVTGTVKGKEGFTGGMFGQAVGIHITNCYANVDVIGANETDENGVIVTGGFAGSSYSTSLKNFYIAGSVSGSPSTLITSNFDSDGSVIAFNSGTDKTGEGSAIVANRQNTEELISTIQNWPAFNAGKMFKGYPALNWQTGSDISDPDKPITEATLTEVWKYQGDELVADWDGTAPDWTSSDAIKSKSCTRFATGRDGRMYTVNMTTMSIAEITKNGMKDLYKLPSLEGDDIYGTAISMDEAGNFLIGHYFTKKELSATRWTVYRPSDGACKHFDLGYPNGIKPEEYTETLTNKTGLGRIDCVGRIVGDLTKEALFIIAPGDDAAQNIRFVYANGNGNLETTNLNGSEYISTYLGPSSAQNIVQPAIISMDDYGDTAEEHYKAYIICSTAGSREDIIDAYYDAQQKTACTAIQQTIRNLPYKAKNNGFDTFVLNGHRYFVHSYINSDDAAANNQRPMDIAVFNEAGAIVATWQNIEYASNNGYNSIVAQPLEDGTAYIHLFASCGSMTIGDMQGCGAAAVLKFRPNSSSEQYVQDGSKEHPYVIATADDLCNAWTFVSGESGTEYYFIQTADIDMAGHTDWHAISGHSGQYASIIHYDGQNHIIKNFAPEDRAVGSDSNSYYCTSLFGVASGEIRNLGIVDAYCVSKNFGSGILAAYAGHSQGSSLTVENVFVTGSINCSQPNYAGGFFGSTGNNVTMVNCYANVEVTGAGLTAGLIGRVNNNIFFENVYVAGTVSGTNPYLVCGASRTGNSADLFNVIAFNSGADQAMADGITTMSEVVIVATEETKDQLIAKIQTWPAFNAGKMFKGYPALNWQSGEGVESVLKKLILDYNGRFLTITSPDNADIYYSVNGVDFNRYSGKFDVEGLPIISVFARKPDYPDSTPQQIKIHSYGSDTYVEVDSDGSLSEAYNWTDDATRGDILNNPNLLAFVEDNFTAESGIGRLANIIINGRADHITVSDGWPWYCPREFETTNISFSRDFTKQTAIDGGCAGWETIAVPFDVKTITHNKGVLYPFATNSNSNDRRFWLFESDAIEWQAATEIKANVPYLIAMPNNDIYDEQFNISGQVTFSAENISVPATPDNLDYVYRNGYTISANYSNRPTDDQTLVINDESVDGNAPGSCFVAGTRSARPFEAYLTAPGQSRVPIFNTSAVTEGLMAEMMIKVWTDTPQSVSISAPFNASVNIYDISGRIIRTVNIVGGQTVRITDLPAGIYIIAKNKIAIRR